MALSQPIGHAWSGTAAIKHILIRGNSDEVEAVMPGVMEKNLPNILTGLPIPIQLRIRARIYHYHPDTELAVMALLIRGTNDHLEALSIADIKEAMSLIVPMHGHGHLTARLWVARDRLYDVAKSWLDDLKSGDDIIDIRPTPVSVVDAFCAARAYIYASMELAGPGECEILYYFPGTQTRIRFDVGTWKATNQVCMRMSRGDTDCPEMDIEATFRIT